MNKNKCDLTVFCNMYRMPLDGQWKDSVVAYHVTSASNVESILCNGLKAKSCQATTRGPERRRAVYLFGSKQDALDTNVRAALFGDNNNLSVMKVTIPQSAFENMREDGLFNVSVICSDGSTPYGIQYINDIPAEWIEVVM